MKREFSVLDHHYSEEGRDYAPFPLTAKLNKLTINVDRPQLSPDDIKKLEAAMRNNKVSEQARRRALPHLPATGLASYFT